MKFEVYPYVRDHYLMIAAWFDARKFPAPEEKFLPPTGVLVSLNCSPLACGFMFRTDAGLASIGHLITNPAANKDVRQGALNKVISSLTDQAAREGFNRVVLAANVEKLFPRFEELGFEKLDSGVATFRRLICQ